MSEIVLPSENIKNLIHQLIEDHNFKNIDICVSKGSEKGDNYVGEIYRIKILSKIDKHVFLSVILKTTPSNDKKHDVLPIHDIYEREAVLYNVILPAFEIFQKEYEISYENLFKSAKCYKANNDLLLLEDLNEKGFKMHDRYACLDDNHLILALTSLAHYHAISFAMKEYKSETFESFTNLIQESILKKVMDPILRRIIPQTISIVKDDSKKEKLTKFSANIVENFHSYITSEIGHPYNVICHADCWNNNFLFKYKDEIPVEMIFLDWQISRYSSPATDIIYMVYCNTDNSIRDRFGSKIYDIYYDALAMQLQKYKCDVAKCYPREAYDIHIKKIRPLGFIMSMIAIPIILCEKGKEIDITDMCKPDDNDGSKLDYNETIIKRIDETLDEFIKFGIL